MVETNALVANGCLGYHFIVKPILAEDLQNFEKRIADLFNKGLIPYPIHLSDGNENSLIELFSSIQKSDWVFSTWRSHYHCLLKGVTESELENAILNGHSISLNFPSHRIYSSAIVGGQISHAVGVAMSIKMQDQNDKVWCFMGDMASETGIAQTAFAYSENFDLPITFVIEDNNQSVLTNTRKVWGSDILRYERYPNTKVISYKYSSSYPHAGAGVRVEF